MNLRGDLKVLTRKKFFASAAVLALMTSVFAGCSSNGAQKETTKNTASGSTEITVWADASHIEAVKDAAKEFTQKSGVKVTLVQKDFGQLRQDLITQVPAGKGPDVSIGPNDWAGLLATDGVIQPIELGKVKDQFAKAAIDAFTYNGQTYGVPYSVENLALIRNTELAPQAPKTWDDMKAAGKAAGTEYPYLLQVSENGDPYSLYPAQTSFGSFVFAQKADGSYDPSKMTIGDDNGKKFAQWMASEAKEGNLLTAMTGDIALSKFTSKASPFFITGPWNVEAIKKAGIHMSVDPLPSAGGQPAKPFVGVQGFYLSAKTKNKLAATNFLTNFIATPDVQEALYKAGNVPPALTVTMEKVASDPVVKGFIDAGKGGVPLPNITQMAAVWQSWAPTEVSIINQRGDAGKLWSKMASDIAATLKK
ncbi:extracellular solute-binding protein [Arcanobacterium canis]|uniref:Maltose ABC transporter substrate-binding protein n=1 Tax=Arcanobacterium canis TaxID=999183 RepID=A0ABY8G121_9ACTO|nr:maltose ABC transporter substrate-binding protein [Arcanobacterium canis]WFM82961.1 maltose ABC transporter substrate-binding protein [Arcanobacterium canis]